MKKSNLTECYSCGDYVEWNTMTWRVACTCKEGQSCDHPVCEDCTEEYEEAE